MLALGELPMNVSHVGRATSWSTTAAASASQKARLQVAGQDSPRPERNFFRGAIIGLIIVAPFWAAVAWVVRGMLR
jgi:hypothetical protein